MERLRETIERDLSDTVEGDFALPVTLIAPDGRVLGPYQGLVRYTTIELDPSTGAPVVVERPSVTLRRSSLARVPADGEIWGVRIPSSPSTTSALATYVFQTRPSDGGAGLGFITLPLQQTEQYTPPEEPAE